METYNFLSSLGYIPSPNYLQMMPGSREGVKSHLQGIIFQVEGGVEKPILYSKSKTMRIHPFVKRTSGFLLKEIKMPIYVSTLALPTQVRSSVGVATIVLGENNIDDILYDLPPGITIKDPIIAALEMQDEASLASRTANAETLSTMSEIINRLEYKLDDANDLLSRLRPQE